MKKPKSVALLVGAVISYVAVLVMFASSSHGQTRGSSQETPQATEQLDRQDPRDHVPPGLPDWGEAMRQSQGSLMRASTGVAVDPEANAPRSEYERASVLAVPPPVPRVIRPHDLVTIIVREQSEFRSAGNISLEKKAELTAVLNEFIQLSGGGITPAIGATKPRIDAQGERSFEGDGKVSRNDSMTARVTAEVIDVRPNGTLVLAARKRIKTDEEEQTFLLSGVARASDISLDNTILSTQLADLDLQKQTKGPVRNATKRGWLPRLVDWVNPF